MKYTHEELEKKYTELPDDIREAMSSVDMMRSAQNIGKSYSLHVDQIGNLMDEISFVMLGITHPSDFISTIQKTLEIDSQKAHEITKDINERIFRPIKVSLLSIHGLKQEKEIPKKEASQRENEEQQNKINYTQLPPISTQELKYKPEIAEKDMVEEKLGGEFKISSTEKEISGSKPQKVAVDKPADPYREPIE